MDDAEAERQRRIGRIIAAAFIGYGVIGGLYLYVRDSTSFDFFAVGYALEGALVHAVLFSLAGLLLMAWRYRKAREPFED
jgi:prolipoprotein diacylglyceryltransferase